MIQDQQLDDMPYPLTGEWYKIPSLKKQCPGWSASMIQHKKDLKERERVGYQSQLYLDNELIMQILFKAAVSSRADDLDKWRLDGAIKW